MDTFNSMNTFNSESHKEMSCMLRKISSSSFAKLLFATLLLITFLYYLYPGIDPFFKLFSISIGIIFFSLMLLAILCISISIIKIGFKYLGSS